ncbi:MAG TPA: hypothetical protein ACQGQW_05245, partial [Xylella fastidiosa subsp. pauca]
MGQWSEIGRIIPPVAMLWMECRRLLPSVGPWIGRRRSVVAIRAFAHPAPLPPAFRPPEAFVHPGIFDAG